MGIDAPRALKQLRAEELRELCKEHGLSHVGKKGDMVERLVAFRGGEAAVANRLLAKSPKAKATASPQGPICGSPDGEEFTLRGFTDNRTGFELWVAPEAKFVAQSSPRRKPLGGLTATAPAMWTMSGALRSWQCSV